jgi:hypothetical protein
MAKTKKIWKNGRPAMDKLIKFEKKKSFSTKYDDVRKRKNNTQWKFIEVRNSVYKKKE